jgi:hypothetical protein
MADVEILYLKYRSVSGGTQGKKEQYIIAVARYGGLEVDNPLPAYWVQGADSATLDSEAFQGMEDLAEALLRYRDHMKRTLYGGRQP